MLCIEEKITLDFDKIDAPKVNGEALLKLYIPNEEMQVSAYTPNRPTVIVLPGGAYSGLSERETDPIALKYLSYGFNAAILYYSCAPDVFPVALLQTLCAVKYIRDNAQKLFAAKDEIYLCGFSAGGHLAASAGTMWNKNESKRYFENTNDVKPNGLILCYPVITSSEFTHGGSIQNLLGDKANDRDMRDYVSLEKRVDKDTPTTFIFSTFGDEAVLCENTMLFASALRKNDIPFEMHIFEGGPHGIATADNVTCPMLYPYRTRSWCEMSRDWIYEKRQKPTYEIYLK